MALVCVNVKEELPQNEQIIYEPDGSITCLILTRGLYPTRPFEFFSMYYRKRNSVTLIERLVRFSHTHFTSLRVYIVLHVRKRG